MGEKGETWTHSVNANETFQAPACPLSVSIAVGIESCRYPLVAVYTKTWGIALAVMAAMMTMNAAATAIIPQDEGSSRTARA